jgi:hypothetical protein
VCESRVCGGQRRLAVGPALGPCLSPHAACGPRLAHARTHTFLMVSPQSPHTNHGMAARCFDERGRKKNVFSSLPTSSFFHSFSFSSVFFGRALSNTTPNKMTQQLHPNVLWAQRRDKLFLTIDLQVREKGGERASPKTKRRAGIGTVCRPAPAAY